MNSPESLNEDALSQEERLQLEDAPLLQLLDKQMHDMTPEELRERVTQLREITSSPISLKKSLTNKKADEKAARTTAPKASGADLASKYLNLGKKGTE
jgi:hypothetical protein